MSKIKISDSNQQEIQKWSRLKNSQIWEKIQIYLQERIKAADQIINAIGADNQLEFTKRDIALIKKQEAEGLLNLPDIIMGQLADTGQRPIENMDAFGDKFAPDQSLEQEGEDW